MKTTFLVKKNPNLPGTENNWLVMSSDEFEAFKQTAEGKARAKYLYQLDRCSEDDAAIYAEVDSETFSKWRVDENHKDYLIRVNKKIGYKVFSYHGIELDMDAIAGEDILKDETCDVEQEVLDRIEISELYTAIAKLSAEDQELIRAFYLTEQPMTIREFEAITGIPNQTVSYRKNRAYMRLKKLMGN